MLAKIEDKSGLGSGNFGRGYEFDLAKFSENWIYLQPLPRLISDYRTRSSQARDVYKR